VAAEAPLACVIEIPKGSRNKYEYDPELGGIKLDRFVSASVVYPTDYGYVPDTLAPDGDPLDVLVLVIEPTFAGCLVAARPIGLLEMVDGGKEDDKILAVPVSEPAFEEIHNFTQVFPHLLRKVSHFFETYKTLEGKHTQVGEWRDAAHARRVISESHQRFLDAHP